MIYELDAVAAEARFGMMLGGKLADNRDSDRVFQYGQFKGVPSIAMRLYANGKLENSLDSKPKPASRDEFDRIVAQYEADRRWSRIA